MLNHLPLNKLMATYQRATYAEEQKKAWIAWGNIVEQKITKSLENIAYSKAIEHQFADSFAV